MSRRILSVGEFIPTENSIEMPPKSSKNYGRIDKEELRRLIKEEKVVVIPVADREKPEAEKRKSKPKIAPKENNKNGATR